MHYAKVKREKVGRCNICLEEGLLSWDHVPPQGSFDPAPTEIRTVFQVLTAREPVKGSTRDSQNGVKFRTICKPCNEKLGQEVDPTLIDFTTQLGRFLTSRLELPPVITIQTKPNRLLRAVLAHLVSAKAELDDALFDSTVRPSCRSLETPIPDGIFVFYWVYPHPEQVVLRDVGMPAKRGVFNDVMFCHLLKFFPIAFLVSDASAYEGLPDLSRYKDSGPDEIAEVRIDLRDIRPRGWPETPDRGNILFGGQAMASSIVGIRR